MSENPYAAPGSEARSTLGPGNVKLYSPIQIAIGAVLGGPVGLVYFLSENFSALGRERLRRGVLLLGAVLVLLLAVLNRSLRIPGLLFYLTWFVIGFVVAAKYQLTGKQITASAHYALQSSWRMIGLSLVCCLVSFVVVSALLKVMAYFWG